MTGLKQVSVRKIWMTRHRSDKNDKMLRENRKEEKPFKTQACCLGYERNNSFYPIDWTYFKTKLFLLLTAYLAT